MYKDNQFIEQTLGPINVHYIMMVAGAGRLGTGGGGAGGGGDDAVPRCGEAHQRSGHQVVEWGKYTDL